MTSRPPRIWARGTDRPSDTSEETHKLIGDDKLIAVIYAPVAQVAKWVEGELDRDGATVKTARDLPQLMKELVEDPASRPNVLVVDIDAITPGELMELHSIRERGWFGTIIGLGKVPAALKTSLGIDHAIRPPFMQNQLRDAVVAVRAPGETIPIPVMRERDKRKP